MNTSEFNKRFAALRREAIACDFTRLNDIQLCSVLATEGPLLLLAGAGSGKTTVLTSRIENLIKYGYGSDSDFVPQGATEDDIDFLERYVSAFSSASPLQSSVTADSGTKDSIDDDDRLRMQHLCSLDPVPPWRIIAITFTNKAAAEMKQRLDRALGTSAKDIWAMTFHSACARILRQDIDRLGYERSFTIYDMSDTGSLMKRILKDMDIDEKIMSPRTALSYISHAKGEMVFAEDYMQQMEARGEMRERMVAKIYVEYESRLKAANALDFDDLLLLAVRLLMDNKDILEQYQRRFRYVLIDEYQDTNKLQYRLAAALAGGHGNICVVGDDDQSIYKFRGATIENILNFEKRFKDAKVIRLEQNYRSTGYILSASNDVIRKNIDRKGKELWTVNERGKKPELHLVEDERAEAQFVADSIVDSVANGRQWHEHAILYRMNAQSNQLETAFKRAGIPYRVLGGTGFYERAEIKDMLAYLCAIHNPKDDARLLRIINKPARGIGNTSVSRLVELSGRLGCSLFEGIYESQKDESLRSAAGRLHQFADMLVDLRDAAETLPLDELYELLLNRSGYIKMLEERDTNENISRLENVYEMKTNILNYMKEHEDDGSLFGFLSETALYTDSDRDDTDTDHVNLMTMHSAKGLEFDTVFIIGAEEGVFPSSMATYSTAEIEEERRLCYVAMTRAMKRLYFIRAKQRTLFGKTVSAQVSRFIGEISKENIDYIDSYHGYGNSFSKIDYQDEDDNVASTGVRSFEYASRTQQGAASLAPDTKPLVSISPIEIPEYRKGDTVVHTSFGRGIILNIQPSGNDALMEVAFEESGTKRLMRNSVARYLRID